MKPAFVLLLLSLAVSGHLQAQGPVEPGGKRQKIKVITTMTPAVSKAKRQLVSLDVHVPVDAFAKSHLAGVGLNYTWSRFGYLSYYKKQKIAFTANGGVDYYIGKKKEIADHSFTYGGYAYLYAHAGVLGAVYRKVVVSLTAGPALGLYKGNTDFGWGSDLFSGFYIKNSSLLIGPGITFKKTKDAAALWTVAARVSYTF